MCHIQDTHWGNFTPLQRCSRCILQLHPGGWAIKWGEIVKILNIQNLDTYQGSKCSFWKRKDWHKYFSHKRGLWTESKLSLVRRLYCKVSINRDTRLENQYSQLCLITRIETPTYFDEKKIYFSHKSESLEFEIKLHLVVKLQFQKLPGSILQRC